LLCTQCDFFDTVARMRILSIETSCDETAVSLVEANGGLVKPRFSVLGNSLFSQIDIHKEYGGVFPMVAKREHAKNLPLLLEKTLKQADEYSVTDSSYSTEAWDEIKKILSREEGLFDLFEQNFETVGKPDIDAIAVTYGPGLEPALWVGISFALALSNLWNIPIVPVNHMEGHIFSVLLSEEEKPIQFPALALLISGGHTELVLMKDWGQYEILGQTKDDAVGEAFDKVARVLGLPYPGGPQISKLAELAREKNFEKVAKLPRPMIHSGNLDFSFSGLKTAVLYYVRDNPLTNDTQRADIAREFEDAVVEVLLKKTKEALNETLAKTLVVAGGVIANKKLREEFLKLEKEFRDLIVKTPTGAMSTDNAIMISCAAYINAVLQPDILKKQPTILANGNLHLDKDK